MGGNPVIGFSCYSRPKTIASRKSRKILQPARIQPSRQAKCVWTLEIPIFPESIDEANVEVQREMENMSKLFEAEHSRREQAEKQVSFYRALLYGSYDNSFKAYNFSLRVSDWIVKLQAKRRARSKGTLPRIDKRPTWSRGVLERKLTA